MKELLMSIFSDTMINIYFGEKIIIHLLEEIPLLQPLQLLMTLTLLNNRQLPSLSGIQVKLIHR